MGRLRHLVETQDITPEVFEAISQRADEFQQIASSDGHLRNVPAPLKKHILLTLFYEPSTRTRLSFESAMMRLGGRILTTENAREFSSAKKGETIEDTARVVDRYADAVVIRHYEQGSVARAAAVSNVPVINAGDGSGQHPTQAILDIYTIKREFGRLDGLNILFFGDLASARTVRSNCYLLGKLAGEKPHISFVSPPSLAMGQDILDYLTKKEIPFRIDKSLNEAIKSADVIYALRTQTERKDPADSQRLAKEVGAYEAQYGPLAITPDNLHLVRPHARILHPLPHNDELHLPLQIEQTDNRVAWFRQSDNGLFVRMGILDYLLAS